jgi:hypothetical protein
LASIATPAIAAQVTIIYNGQKVQATPVSVFIDGVQLAADAFAVRGRTMGPVRAVFEALGATVDWDPVTSTAIGKRSGLVIRMTINQTTAYVGDQVVTLTTPAAIINGRTYVPVRFVAEAMGAALLYDDVNLRVDITSPKSEEPPPPPETPATPPATGIITHQGPIDPAGETWAAGDHLVANDFLVVGANAPVLTIEAGARVFFAPGTSIIVGKGNAGGIKVNGTPQSRVQFSTNVSTIEAAQPGSWNGIEIGPGILPGSVITNADFFFAGGKGSAVAIEAWNGQLYGGAADQRVEISNTYFANCANSAIRLAEGARLSPKSVLVAVTGMVVGSFYPGYPIVTGAAGLSTLPVGEYTGNAKNAVLLTSGEISENTTIRNLGIPYLAETDINVGGKSSPVLTIEPGVKLLFTNPGCGLNVGVTAPGKLVADASTVGKAWPNDYLRDSFNAGAAEQQLRAGLELAYQAMSPGYDGPSTGKNPAIVVGFANRAARGAWKGINLGLGTDPTTTLRGVVIFGAETGLTVEADASGLASGFPSERDGIGTDKGTFTPQGSLTVADSLIVFTLHDAIRFGGAPRFTTSSVDNILEDNGGTISVADINSLGSFATPDWWVTKGPSASLSGTLLPGPITGPFTPPGTLNPSMTGPVCGLCTWKFLNNTRQAIQVRDYSRVTRSLALFKLDVPLEFSKGLAVDGSNKPALAIQPGARLLFDSGAELQIGGTAGGSLIAIGDANNPITFNAAKPDGNSDWKGIIFAQGADTSEIRNVTIGNASAGLTMETTGSVRLADITLSSCGTGIFRDPAVTTPGLPTELSGLTGDLRYAIRATSDEDLLPWAQSLGITFNNCDALFNKAASLPPLPGDITKLGMVVPLRPEGRPITHAGTINPAGETWGPGDHLVMADFLVEGAGGTPTLTIEAGARVFFAPGTSMMVGKSNPGRLVVKGTPSARVQFTGYFTDISRAQPGSWNGIQFGENALGGSLVDNADFFFGGSGSGTIVTYMNKQEQPAATIRNVNIAYSRGAGLKLMEGARLSADSVNLGITGTVSDSSSTNGFPIISGASGLSTLPIGDYFGNERNVVCLTSGGINADATLRNVGVPYYSIASISVGGKLSPTLTVEPGVKVLFANPRCGLSVGLSAPGRLLADATIAGKAWPSNYRWGGFDTAQYARQLRAGLALSYDALAKGYSGTPAGTNPAIVFAWADQVANGGWEGVTLGKFADPATVLKGVVISGARTGLNVAATSIQMPDGSFRPSSSSTLRALAPSGNFLLSYSLITGSEGEAISFTNVPRLASGSLNNTLENNGGTISVENANSLGTFGAEEMMPSPPCCLCGGWVFDRNDRQAIQIRELSTVSGTLTFFKLPVALQFEQGLAVDGPNLPTLTIKPGARLLFGAGAGLRIGGNYGGTLNAVGSATDLITFARPDGNADWKGIEYAKGASNSQLRYALVSNAACGLSQAGAGSLQVGNVTFRQCATGIYRDPALVTIAATSTDLLNARTSGDLSLLLKGAADMDLANCYSALNITFDRCGLVFNRIMLPVVPVLPPIVPPPIIPPIIPPRIIP